MKVLFFLINFNLGGTEKSFLNLVESLPEKYEIDVLVLEKKGLLLNEIPERIRLIEIQNKDDINKFIELGARQYGIIQLKRGHIKSFILNAVVFLAQKINLDINPFLGIDFKLKKLPKPYDVAVAYAGPHDFISYYILKKTQARKKIQWIHFDVSKVIKNKVFGRNYYHKFNSIVCVADNVKTVFAQMFPLTKEKIFTFNNLIPEQKIKNLAENGETFTDDYDGIRILTLGRLSREKGQYMIPNVVKRLKQEGLDFKWYLIGEGNIQQKIQSDINNLGIKDELKILGLKTNPYKFLKDCDFLVLTSLYEGDPVVLREAKVFHKPIAATNFLNASNLIKNEEDGLIVEISEEGLYNGVKRLLMDEDLRRSFEKSLLVSDTSSEITRLFKLFEL